MDCPIEGCTNTVESGQNCYIEVELGNESLRKLVCDECAKLYMSHLQ